MKTDDLVEKLHYTQYTPGMHGGHYESFFLRANHPSRPLAFWIRYTIFSPAGNPEKTLGELWAVFFNGETSQHTAVKTEHPFRACSFSSSAIDIRIGSSFLGRDSLAGSAGNHSTNITWDLDYQYDENPLYDIPLKYYNKGFPRAKALVTAPLAVFSGTLSVNGEKVPVEGWVGSQNHNWGSRHTDFYAWGQVAGFDNSPGTFLEIATAQIKIGPFKTPFMTPIVLRHNGTEYALNELHTLAGRARFTYFNWKFKAASPDIRLSGIIAGNKNDFVCLPYYNPPGGIKHCLNTKIASCSIVVYVKKTGSSFTLETRNRAAFEILTDNRDHGLSPAVPGHYPE